MHVATYFLLLAALGATFAAPADAAYFYTTRADIRTADQNVIETTASNTGGPPNSSATIPRIGSTASTTVSPGRIATVTTGNWNTIAATPPGEDPLGNGFVQSRGLGYVEDTLTVTSAAPSGFLKVAIVYENSGFTGHTPNPIVEGTSVAVYDIYYRFSAGAFGSEIEYVDYNRRLVTFNFSSGFGFNSSGISTDFTSGNFNSGRVFLVPFNSGEALSIALTGDCTGSAQVMGSAAGFAGCGANQRFGWGGIIGATDADGNAITLTGVNASSGANYLSNLAGVAFTPNYSVPEPAVWMQFILGFGLAGAFVRRRRALAA